MMDLDAFWLMNILGSALFAPGGAMSAGGEHCGNLPVFRGKRA